MIRDMTCINRSAVNTDIIDYNSWLKEGSSPATTKPGDCHPTSGKLPERQVPWIGKTYNDIDKQNKSTKTQHIQTQTTTWLFHVFWCCTQLFKNELKTRCWGYFFPTDFHLEVSQQLPDFPWDLNHVGLIFGGLTSLVLQVDSLHLVPQIVHIWEWPGLVKAHPGHYRL